MFSLKLISWEDEKTFFIVYLLLRK